MKSDFSPPFLEDSGLFILKSTNVALSLGWLMLYTVVVITDILCLVFIVINFDFTCQEKNNLIRKLGKYKEKKEVV